MSDIVDRMRKTHKDFLTVYRSPDAIKNDYIPQFYSDLLKDADTLPSSEALALLTKHKAMMTYVGGINWMHKTLADSYGDKTLQDDPRYLAKQLMDSQNWLLIHLIDDASETAPLHDVIRYTDHRLFGSGLGPECPAMPPARKEVLDFVSTKLRQTLEANHADMAGFKKVWDSLMKAALQEGEAKSMQEYRTVRRKVGIDSGRLIEFFMTGAGDEVYAAQHFGKTRAGIRYSAEKIGEIITLLDNYLDFEQDKKEVMKNYVPGTGDRSWFLYAGVREGLALVIKEQICHAGHFSGATAHFMKKFGKQTLNQILEPLKTRFCPTDDTEPASRHAAFVAKLLETAIPQQKQESAQPPTK